MCSEIQPGSDGFGDIWQAAGVGNVVAGMPAFGDPMMQSRCAEIMERIRTLGGQAEVTLDRLIGIDAAPEVEAAIWNYLDDGRSRGQWELQAGCSPD